MPELPEVQTIVNQLQNLRGRKINSVDIILPAVFGGNEKDIIGEEIRGVERRGKTIVLKLSNGKFLTIHLRMTGRLVYNKTDKINKDKNPITGELPNKHTRAIFGLDKGTLFFNDVRKFGRIKIMSDTQWAMDNQKLGPDALGKEFTEKYLAETCRGWKRPIKLLLLDQEKIAGIGNIYANEILWCARINPRESASVLVRQAPKIVPIIRTCVIKVLREGIKYGGSTSGDRSYVDLLGQPGGMQEHLNVYHRTGKACPRNDGGIIQKSVIGGRGTFFCPVCQG